jgi:hypothetical protein
MSASSDIQKQQPPRSQSQSSQQQLVTSIPAAPPLITNENDSQLDETMDFMKYSHIRSNGYNGTVAFKLQYPGMLANVSLHYHRCWALNVKYIPIQ